MRFKAYSVYLLFKFCFFLLFSMATVLSLVYHLEVVGLNAFELVLIGTVLEASCFLLEIPTGVVADLYSRRRSVLIGIFLYGIGFVLEGFLPWFATVLLAQVVWGCGDTFISGAGGVDRFRRENPIYGQSIPPRRSNCASWRCGWHCSGNFTGKLGFTAALLSQQDCFVWSWGLYCCALCRKQILLLSGRKKQPAFRYVGAVQGKRKLHQGRARVACAAGDYILRRSCQ